MPWKVYANSEGKHCVHKLNADDTQGELVACHDTRAEALAQQRALYASEAKEITDATLNLLKEIADDGNDGKPERANAVLDEWKARIDAIQVDEDEDQEDADQEDNVEEEKQAAPGEPESAKPPIEKKDLFGKLKAIGDKIASWFKDEEPNSGMSIWKEGETYWWLARYSNNFRDQDNPPEIISSDSHKRFVRLVKEGSAELPELWLWHKEAWKAGKAVSVAYDNTGFAIAIGVFDADKGRVAEALMKSKQPLRVSHGMPVSSIKRDSNDPTIIIEHVTREISPLPAWAAANKLTGFVVLNSVNKEESMAIPDETKVEWVKKLGIDPKTLSDLEEANAADASKAKDEGMESKDVEDVSAQPATQPEVPVAQPAPAAENVPAQPADLTPLRDAVTEAVTSLVQPLIARIDALENGIKELKEMSDAQKEALKGTPSASLASIISGFAQSAIGAPETRVDGRTELAKSKPKEASKPMDGRTPVPFINELLEGNK